MSFISPFKRLSKDTFSYGLSSAIQKLITMFLFPVYARLLTPADFGIQDIILSVVNILMLLLILGLDSGVMLYYYESNETEKTKMISSFFWFEQIIAVPVVLFIMYFAPELCYYLFKNSSLSNYLRLGVMAIPFLLMVGAIQSTLRLTFQTTKFVIFSTTGIVLQVGLTIYLVIIYGLGINGIFLSILISNVLQSIMGVFLTHSHYKFTISYTWTRRLLKVGLPLIPASISFWVLSYSNRFFLITYASMEEVGLLSIVNRISSILLLFLTAFSSAWGPYAYSIANDKELARQTYSKVLTYFSVFSLALGTGLSLFSRELIIVLATSVYESGSSLVFLYALSSILWVALYIIGMGTGIAKKNHHYTISILSGAIINILMNYLLIPVHGVVGAAYSTLMGNLVATVYMYFAGQYYFRVNYEFKKLIIVVSITLLTILIGNVLDSQFNQWEITLSITKLFIFFGFILLLFLFGVLNYNVVNQFIQIMRTKLTGSK